MRSFNFFRLVVFSVAAMAALAAGTKARAQSPWLPQPGEFTVAATYVFQTYDRFWLGKDKMTFFDTDQHTLESTFEYGLFEAGDFALALDATVGYVRTIGLRPGAGVEDGLNDVRGGVRLRVLDEYAHDSDYVPTVSLRLGGIIQGTYNVGGPEAPGDGASGFEVSALIGKEIADTGPGYIGFYGDLGYRYRAEDVPEDLFFSIFVYQRFFEILTASFGYRHVQGLSGQDIGDPGFTFPGLKEISQSIEAGLTYHAKDGPDVGLFLAKTLDGRNTADRFVVGISIAMTFGGESTRIPFMGGPRYVD